jgi:hypothetical protein|tara:strand:- start:213 stop:431 length:219 start_codon:yes stop_codon:yes gene_type:complete
MHPGMHHCFQLTFSRASHTPSERSRKQKAAAQHLDTTSNIQRAMSVAISNPTITALFFLKNGLAPRRNQGNT